MEQIKKFFTKKDKFAHFCGIELLEVSPGRARGRMAVQPHHLNGMGSVHGGALFTLADYIFAVAANSHEIVSVAINANMTYVKAINSGYLYAEAQENSVNPKISSYTVRVADDNNDTVAIFQGLAYRKKDKLDLSD
jgi:acyl-CoA thioesterase